MLKPVAYFPDPFRDGDNLIALCETYIWSDEEFTSQVPANTNFRHFASKIFDQLKDHKTWYGIEQEYTMLESANKFTIKPLGWPSSGFPGP